MLFSRLRRATSSRECRSFHGPALLFLCLRRQYYTAPAQHERWPFFRACGARTSRRELSRERDPAAPPLDVVRTAGSRSGRPSPRRQRLARGRARCSHQRPPLTNFFACGAREPQRLLAVESFSACGTHVGVCLSRSPRDFLRLQRAHSTPSRGLGLHIARSACTSRARHRPSRRRLCDPLLKIVFASGALVSPPSASLLLPPAIEFFFRLRRARSRHRRPLAKFFACGAPGCHFTGASLKFSSACGARRYNATPSLSAPPPNFLCGADNVSLLRTGTPVLASCGRKCVETGACARGTLADRARELVTRDRKSVV